MEIWDKSNENYIVNFKKAEDNDGQYIEVEFADGNAQFIDYSEDMEVKLILAMEKQYEDAKSQTIVQSVNKNYARSKLAAITGAVVSGGTIISEVIASAFFDNSNKALTAGIILAGTACLVPAIINMVKNKAKTEESEKIEIRNKNADLLRNIPANSSALNNHNALRVIIEDGEKDPFNINNLRHVESAEDLEEIVSIRGHEEFLEKMEKEKVLKKERKPKSWFENIPFDE